MDYKRAVYILVALLVSLAAVNAVQVTGNFYSGLAQCNTAVQKYSVCAENTGTYFVSIEGGAANWFSVAPASFSLQDGQCQDVYLFVTPECYATAATYAPNFIISGAEDFNRPFTLVVTQAHTFNLNASPAAGSADPCKASLYSVSVKNTGSFTDEFVISESGLPAGWIDYPQDKLIINPHAQADFQLKVTPSCSSNAGSYPFNVTVSNTRTNVFASKSFVQKVNSITPIVVSGPSKVNNSFSVKTCEEFDDSFTVNVKNASDSNDQLSFSLLDSNFMDANKDIAFLGESGALVAPEKSVDVNIFTKGNSARIVPLILRVHSGTYDRNFDAPIDLAFQNCYALRVERTSTDSNACVGNAPQKFVLFNNGSRQADTNISLLSDQNVIETARVVVRPNSSTDFSFILSPSSTGEKSYSVVASSEYSQSRADFNYYFENCFDASLESQGFLVCSGAIADTNVSVKNSGTRPLDFSITVDAPWLSINPPHVSVGASQTKQVELFGKVPNIFSGSYTIKAVSVNSVLTQALDVAGKTFEECNGFDYSFPTDVIDVNCCSGKIVDLNLSNTGAFDENISLKKISPEWVSFSEQSTLLGAGKTKQVYVYLSPPAGTNGPYNGSISAVNDKNISRDINLSLNVFGGNCGQNLGADVNLGGNVSGTQAFTRKEVTIDFVVSNDSNAGFNVTDISAPDFNTSADFNKNVFLNKGDSLVAKITFRFAEGQEPNDQNVLILVGTSAGTLKKNQFVNFSGQMQPISISGLFAAGYDIQVLGVLVVLLVIVLLLLAYVRSGKTKKAKSKKKEQSK